MKILHFIPVYKPAWQYGGPVRSVSTLCESLAACGERVVVATTTSGLCGQHRITWNLECPTIVDGVEVYYFARNPFPLYIESPSLRKHIRSLMVDADLVHLSGVWQPLSLSVTTTARRLKKPYVCSLRGTINSWAWKQRTIRHRLYWTLFESHQLSRASALHMTSDMEREDAVSRGIGIGQKVFVVPNSIDSSQFVRSEHLAWRFRESVSASDAQKLMLYLGRLHAKKGIDLFLNSAAAVLRETPDWLFLIVGPSENGYRDKLMSQVQRLGLSSKVRFVDLVAGTDRLGALSAADLFILTSHTENFGMSVVEAMAASVPVLISDRVGICKEIRSDGAGYITGQDHASIRSALITLISDAGLRSFYAANGRKCVLQRFDTAAVAQQMRASYRELLS
jgi:glycosyltransferase involved in cell wall biosynthesis